MKEVKIQVYGTVLFLFLVHFSPVKAFSQGNEFKDAVEYNDFIVRNQQRIGEELMSFTNAMGSMNLSKSEAREKLNKCSSVIDSVIGETEKTPVYDKGANFREAALDLFGFYKKTVEQDYERLLVLIYDEDKDKAAESEIKEIFSGIFENEKKHDSAFTYYQYKFAEDHGFELE